MLVVTSFAHRLVPAFVSTMCIVGLAAPAYAQVLFGASPDILSKADFSSMHVAASHLYENRTLGAVERWRGPKSKDSGTVELLRNFQTKGMQCARLQYRIVFARVDRSPQTYLVNWCKTGSGAWKIEDHTPPA